MDGGRWLETGGAPSSNNFYNSNEDNGNRENVESKNNKKFEEFDYADPPDMNIHENSSNPTWSKSSSNNNSKEDVTIKKSQNIKVVGNHESEDKTIRSIYITTCFSTHDQTKKVSAAPFENAVQEIISGKIKLRETAHGLVVSFNKEEDCERITKLDMSKIFSSPVVVWNIPQSISKYHKTALIRDIPWCVPIKEVEALLKYQGIHPLSLTRLEGSSIRIEVKSSSSMEKLLNEGLNFYNCVTLPVVLESSEAADIIQCYKCQRFWHTAVHCPYHARCVRCGEKHDVRECLRSRQNAVCCLCGDSHHAAYKLCPVRIQHLNSVQIDFALRREPSKHRT